MQDRKRKREDEKLNEGQADSTAKIIELINATKKACLAAQANPSILSSSQHPVDTVDKDRLSHLTIQTARAPQENILSQRVQTPALTPLFPSRTFSSPSSQTLFREPNRIQQTLEESILVVPCSASETGPFIQSERGVCKILLRPDEMFYEDVDGVVCNVYKNINGVIERSMMPELSDEAVDKEQIERMRGCNIQ